MIWRGNFTCIFVTVWPELTLVAHELVLLFSKQPLNFFFFRKIFLQFEATFSYLYNTFAPFLFLLIFHVYFSLWQYW